MPLPLGPGRGDQPCHTHEGSARHTQPLAPATSPPCPVLPLLSNSPSCVQVAQNPPRPFLWVTGPICEDPAHSHGKRTRDKRGCFCCRESVCVSLLCTPGALLTHSHTPIHTLTRTMHSHTFALIHAHMHLHALTLTFTLICSQTHTYSRAHTLTHMLTHTLTHSHSHTHTRTLSHTHTFFGPPEARAVLVCGHSLPSLRGVRVAGGGRGRLQGSGQHLDSRAEEGRDARSARGLLLRERGEHPVS